MLPVLSVNLGLGYCSYLGDVCVDSQVPCFAAATVVISNDDAVVILCLQYCTGRPTASRLGNAIHCRRRSLFCRS